jgi:hypothetical protein
MSETYQGGASGHFKPDSGQSYGRSDAGPNSFGRTREKLKGLANAQKDAGSDQV